MSVYASIGLNVAETIELILVKFNREAFFPKLSKCFNIFLNLTKDLHVFLNGFEA